MTPVFECTIHGCVSKPSILLQVLGLGLPDPAHLYLAMHAGHPIRAMTASRDGCCSDVCSAGTGTLRVGLCRENETLIQELSIPAPGSKDLHFETRYPQSALSQFRLIFWKCGLPSTAFTSCKPCGIYDQIHHATDVWP